MRHYHIWHFERDADGIIRRAVRDEETYETRGRANYALSDRRVYWSMGRVLACDDHAFCQPPPRVRVTGLSIFGQRVTKTGDKVVEEQESIRPALKHVLAEAKIEEYGRDPDLEVEWDGGSPSQS